MTVSYRHYAIGWRPWTSNIEHIYSNSSTGATSASLNGNGVNGDLVVGGACNTSNATAIPLGTDCLQPTVGGLIEEVFLDGDTLGVPIGLYGVMGYKFIDEGASEMWDGWTNAGSCSAGIYRGVHATQPILACAMRAGTTNPVVYAALSHNNPTAWVVAFLRTSADVTAPPALLTARTTGTRRGQWDSDGPMQNYAGESITASGSPVKWITCVIAIQSE